MCRLVEPVDNSANVVFMPGPVPNNRGTPIDINVFNAAHGHDHDGAQRKTATEMGITLKGRLHKCKYDSMVKDITITFLSKVHDQAGRTVTVEGTERPARAAV